MCTTRFLVSVFAFSAIAVPSSIAFPSELKANGNIINSNVTSRVDRDPGDVAPPPTPHRDANSSSPESGTRAVNRFPKIWAANLFYETLVNFTVSADAGSSMCQRQTQMYARHLENDSLWAVHMSDSWSRYPNGLLVGTSHQMGVYEECINVHQPVQGKYCIPNVILKSTSGEDFSIGKPNKPQIFDHAWREILGYIDNDNQFDRNKMNFGICIPDSCTASDLEISLQKEFDKHFLPHDVKAEVQVDPILCSTDKDEYPFDAGYYVTNSLLGLIIIICCLSTTYHFITLLRNENVGNAIKMPEMISTFSVIKNARNLIKYDSNNDLNIFNGFKVYTMIMVMFGHKLIFFVINPISYGIRLEKVYLNGPHFILTSMNLVDPFFYMTGYLMYVMLIPQFSKPGTNWFQVPMVIVYKYFMMLPSYIVVISLTAFIIPHWSNGPLWASRTWPEADKCKNYWWASILGVSNLIEAEHQCLLAGWYISCLLQFLVIGTLVIYVYVKHRKIGIFLIVTLLCLSLVIPYTLTYIYRGWGLVRLMSSALENPRQSFEFKHLYRAFYLRGTPFYAGLLAGIVVKELKKREITFSKFVVYFGTIAIATISIWIQLYGGKFFDVHRPYDVLEQSLYSTLSHCTWTAILFWVTVCHNVSGYGPIEKLFNNRIMVPLGRLSYAVYLVNITVMIVIESKQRVTVFPSREFIVDGWIFGSFRTYVMAAMLYLIIEAPFALLIKKLLFKKKYSNNDRVTAAAVNDKTITDRNESTNQ